MWNFRLRSFLGGQKDEDHNALVRRRGCDMPGCSAVGDFKAPKSREGLRDYFWFCLDHVREYNQSWDYFKGMNPAEIEAHMRRAVVGDRPSWKMTEAGLYEEKLRERVYKKFTNGESVFSNFRFDGTVDGEDDEPREKPHIAASGLSHPTLEALRAMDLEPPVDLPLIKARYKELAKKYHPDRNNNDPAAEEKLKRVNMAYTILKLSYQTYTDLKEK